VVRGHGDCTFLVLKRCEDNFAMDERKKIKNIQGNDDPVGLLLFASIRKALPLNDGSYSPLLSYVFDV
jgi:hypothetical protein